MQDKYFDLCNNLAFKLLMMSDFFYPSKNRLTGLQCTLQPSGAASEVADFK